MPITTKSDGKIVLYHQKKEGAPVPVRIEKDSVWLNLNQLMKMFGIDKSGISRHMKSIFESGELKPRATVAKFVTALPDGRKYDVEYYNLDMILSVGYRVNSKEGTKFRMWANTVLKQHLLQGYTINQKRLKEGRLKEIEKLEKTLGMIRAAAEQKQLTNDEAKGLLHVISEYAKSWAMFRQYDDGTLPFTVRTTKKLRDLAEEEAERAIDALKTQLLKKEEAGELFAREQKPEGLKSILRNIHQTFDGKPVYMSVEERASHLLYFIIKDHPFVDGNKRIGSLLFLLFLQRHGRLQNKNGGKTITDAALVAIALLIAQSKPQEKELMIALVQNLL